MAEKEKDDSRAFELKRATHNASGDERTKGGESRRNGSDSHGAVELDSLPPHLRRKYYVVEVDAAEARIYADRGGEYLVAKAGRDRLVTQVASIEVVRDLVAIAAHRGWERVELTGSLEFRREAWLIASARGIEAKGYMPTELDRAALAKMQNGFEQGDKAPAFARDGTNARSQQMQRSPSGPTERDRANGSNYRNERSHLAVIERVVLAAFPKDPEARKRVLDAARDRMAHHRRRGARFDRAEIIKRKEPTREAPVTTKLRTKGAGRADRSR